MPQEYTRLKVSLSFLDERIRLTQESMVELQVKGQPVGDVEQTLITLLEARRLLQARLDSKPNAAS